MMEPMTPEQVNKIVDDWNKSPTTVSDYSDLPITAPWLRSMGFLPDDSGSGDLFLKIWQPGEPSEVTMDDGFIGERCHLWVCDDWSYGFESYDNGGQSMAILSVGQFKTRGDVRALCMALGDNHFKFHNGVR